MRRSRAAVLTLGLWTAVVALTARAHAAPAAAPGFVVENAIPQSHIEAPVALAFLPDGRLLVADVPGRIWIIDHGIQLPAPMWAHETEVEINGDCGLLGMVLDPDFAINRRIYLSYAVDPDSNGVDDDSVHFGRVVRYEVSAADPDKLDESTRTVLLGTGWSDGIPVARGTHSTGSLQFGADGTLLVSAGDGARYDRADAGGLTPELFSPGRAPAAFDVGAYRAQQLDCPDGKILRLDPATGHGLPSNPFWDGDPNSVRSKVWALGLRNPFRFTLRPGTGAAAPAQGAPGMLYVGDVGWDLWDELDIASAGGANFEWPCREAGRANAPYAPYAYANCGTAGLAVRPALELSHVSADSSAPIGTFVRANAITPGPFYEATQFPQPWRERLIVGDFYRGWIRAARFDAGGRFGGWDELATDMQGPVDYAVEPATGWLYVACIIDDRVRRIRWAPVAGAGPTATAAELSQARPNPTYAGASWTLTLEHGERVSFEIVDLGGRRVWQAPPAEHAPGLVTLAWNGRDAGGGAVAPGVYLARVRAGGRAWARRFITLR